MTTRRQFLANISVGTVALATTTHIAWARNTFPSRPVRLVCASPAGAPIDAISRKLAELLSRRLGVAVVVENKAGAVGVLAASDVARSTDGHSFLVTTNSPLVTAPSVMKSLPYDPATAFALISKVGASPVVLVANPGFKANSLAELVADLKSGKLKATYGSWGPGTMPVQVMESFARKAGVKVTEVPYRGSPPALQDVLANQVDMTFLSPHVAAPMIAEGKLKPLAVVGKHRAKSLPNVQTFPEAGFRDFIFTNATWAGVAGPARMERATLDRMASEIQACVRDPAMDGFLASIGFEAVGNTPAAFNAEFRAELAVIPPLLRDLGVVPQ